jgi:hypothetical protein
LTHPLRTIELGRLKRLVVHLAVSFFRVIEAYRQLYLDMGDAKGSSAIAEKAQSISQVLIA